MYAVLRCVCAVLCLSVFFHTPRGAHPPPAGPTQLSRVTPTTGGRRLQVSLTDEGRLTHLISGVPNTWTKLACNLNAYTPYVYYSIQAMHT